MTSESGSQFWWKWTVLDEVDGALVVRTKTQFLAHLTYRADGYLLHNWRTGHLRWWRRALERR